MLKHSARRLTALVLVASLSLIITLAINQPAPEAKAPRTFSDDPRSAAMLIAAVARRDVEETRRLLAAGANPNQRVGDDRQSLLQGLADPEILRLLLEAGADPNATDDYDCAPLNDAPNGTITKALLRYGANPFPDHSSSPLLTARDAETVTTLIAAGVPVGICGHAKITPLHEARNADVAKALLASGADPNARNLYEQTPLMFAKSLEIAKLLLDNGADPNAVATPGWGSVFDHSIGRPPIAIHLLSIGVPLGSPASWRNATDPALVDALLEAGVDPKSIRLAGIADPARLRKLIMLGADPDPNIVYDFGTHFEPLTVPLSYCPSPAIAKILLAAGADPNRLVDGRPVAVNSFYSIGSGIENPEALAYCDVLLPHLDFKLFDYLGSCRSEALMRRFLSAGADPANSRALGQAVWLSEEKGDLYYRLAEFLLSSGADPNVLRGGSSTLAVSYLREHAFDLLVAHGARADSGAPKAMELLFARNFPLTRIAEYIAVGGDLEKRDEYGRTAVMHHALQVGGYHNSWGSLEALVKAGADLDATDDAGMTALHLLVLQTKRRRIQTKVIHLLIAAGADPLIVDKAGLRPIDYCDEIKFPDIVKSLNETSDPGQ